MDNVFICHTFSGLYICSVCFFIRAGTLTVKNTTEHHKQLLILNTIKKMEISLRNPWLWIVIIAAVIILAEIGRNIINLIYQKELKKEQAGNVSRNLAMQKLNHYPYHYDGVIFFKGKNIIEARKKYLKFSEEQKLLQKTLDEKLKKSK